jgi:hypothetical protein
VDVHAGRLAEVLDGLGVGVGGLHVVGVGCAFRQVYITTVPVYAMGSRLCYALCIALCIACCVCMSVCACA